MTYIECDECTKAYFGYFERPKAWHGTVLTWQLIFKASPVSSLLAFNACT